MFNEASVETAQVVATNAIYWTRNNRCVLAFDQKGRELLFKLTAYTFSERENTQTSIQNSCFSLLLLTGVTFQLQQSLLLSCDP